MKKNTKKQHESQRRFSDLGKIIDVIRIDEYAKETFCFHRKNHNNLAAFGINVGDSLIVHRAKTFDENQLSLWTDDEGERFVGFAFDNFGDISIDCKAAGIFRYKKKTLPFAALWSALCGIMTPWLIKPKKSIQ